MRIGLVSTLSTPVRAVGAGSVEGLVFLLARELTTLGHEVTVFAAERSVVPGCSVVAVPGTYGVNGMPDDYQQCEILNLSQALRRSGDLDVLHAHAYLLGRLLEDLSAAPVVHTLHTQAYEPDATLARLSSAGRVTALSRYQWSAFPDIDPVVIAHGVDPAAFTFRPQPERRLCFLGRFLPGKGPLHAIRVARELSVPLILAGPENDYFTDVVRPHLDGTDVEYVGTVDGATRDELLGRSSALLYPVTHGEPFGLVMAEAMMCGTPVAALATGAVPEIVEDGVTGRVASTAGTLADATVGALALDRAVVREAAARRFSAARMARDYAAVYDDVVDTVVPPRPRCAAVTS